MRRRIWKNLLIICILLGCTVVPILADAAAPVYIPSAPRAEALTAAEDIDSDASLPTVTVRGFLNFRTTVDGTVIVFTPASAEPQNPTPASNAPAAASSAAPSNSLSPRNDEIQHLTYTNNEREAQKRTELENEAHTPEDDRQNYMQRHLKPGYADLGTTPGTLKNEEPQQNLQKPGATPSLPQYPTGLVTVLGGTHVKDGATTVFETKVIGTYIEGKYAQILQSTSQIIFPAKPEDLSTPKPSPTKPVYQKSVTMTVSSSRPISVKPNNDIDLSSKSYKPTTDSATKDYGTTTAESRQAERRTDEPINANTVIQSSFKLPEVIANRQPVRPTQSLEKTLDKSSYSLSRRFRPTLATDIPPDENTVPETQNGRNLPPRYRYVLPRRNTPSVRLNRFKVKLTARNDEGHVTDRVPTHDNTFDAEDDLLEDYDPLHPVDPAKVIYSKTTITSEVTLHVGRRKSVRTLTITTSVPKTRHIFMSDDGIGMHDPHDISPANNNAIFATLGDEDSPPNIVVTRTYTTTERMLKTSVVPILENDTTSYHTVTESFFILKLITGYKTLPAADMTMLHNETSEIEFDESSDALDGLLEGAVSLQPSPRQQIVQTPIPNGLLQASGSGRQQAIVPYDETRGSSSELSNSLLNLGAALQNNPLAAVYLGLQQLNRHATLYSTKTKTATYTHTDTIYSTKVVSFYDGRRTRTRTLSESISTTEKIMTSLTTTVEPYLNTQLFQHQNQLQQLLGSGAGPQLLAPPPQYSTITSTYTTVTTATSLSTRIYTLIYNAISTKFRTVTSTSLYETTVTATTTSEVPITITAPPGGVFPFLG